MAVGHPLLESHVKSAIESAASRHLGRRWVSYAFTDLKERASHPCGVLHGEPFSVFAKLDIGDNAEEKFQAELSGLTLLRDRARIAIPTPIGTGLLQLDQGSVLLTEALSVRPPEDRTPDDWRAIGHTLATLHQVPGGWFGLENFSAQVIGGLQHAHLHALDERLIAGCGLVLRDKRGCHLLLRHSGFEYFQVHLINRHGVYSVALDLPAQILRHPGGSELPHG